MSVLVLTGCAAKAHDAPVAAEAPAERLATTPARARAVPRYLAITGQIKSSRETDLAANAAGRVVGTSVERGAQVKAGDVLATLDTRAAALSAAEAKLQADMSASSAATTKRECERTRQLVASGALGAAELDRMSGQCTTSELAANAAVTRSQLAAQNVGDGVIRAPFSGFVAERFVDVGEFVQRDSKVVTLVDLSALRLELTVPEANVTAAQPGARVEFHVAGYPDRTFTAAVAFVGASVRASTRDLVVEAKVDATDALLRPGMFVSGRLASGEEQAPVVPKSALASRDQKTTAFVVKDGRLEQRVVQTGDTLGDEVAILRGLSDGEKVVTTSTDKLKNGLRVAEN